MRDERRACKQAYLSCQFRSSTLLIIGILYTVFSSSLVTAETREIIGGVEHIFNGNRPSNGVETWQLEELWDAGGEDDEDVLFGIITQVEIGIDGNVYLLDAQLSQVFVYSPNGLLLRTLGRSGEGPGEVTNPAAMTIMPNGSVGLVKTMPGKLVILDCKGIPLDDFVPAGFEANDEGLSLALRCYSAAPNLVFGGMKLTYDSESLTQTRICHITSFGNDRAPITEYYSKTVIWDFKNFVLREIDIDFPWQRMAVSKNGTLFIAPDWGSYAIEVFQMAGNLSFIIHRDYKPYERNREMKAFIDRAFLQQMANPQIPPNATYEAEDFEPDIASLHLLDNGSLWVHNSWQQWASEPNIFSYDVFSPDGNFVREVRIECPGSAKNDRLFFSSEDRIYKVSGFLEAVLATQGLSYNDDIEAEPMAITCYRRKSFR